MHRSPSKKMCIQKAATAARAACAVLVLAALTSTAEAGGLEVFAAASLTDALAETGRTWEAATGQSVHFNFAASSDLARQIRAGARADVFVSADATQVDGLERAGLVRADQRVNLLSNTLVVVVPRDSTWTPSTAGELRQARHLALADPETVPGGVYARQWLESVGLWTELRARVVPALDVRAALALVEAGHAEAGVVYRTDAARTARARIAFTVPRVPGAPIVYVAAPLTSARHAEAAAAFLRHLRSAGATRIFERHGFLAPAAP